MSINSFSHYSLFPGLFVAFTYHNKQPPAFGAAPAFLCTLLPFLGLSFRHLPKNLSNSNVLTANAPFFYQISGTWSNHEGSILSWCWIPSFYGFLLCYRGQPQSHNVSKRRGYRETLLFSFVSNFVRNWPRSLREPFYDILESSHANELFHESLRARYSRIFSIYLPIYREYPRISSFRYSKEDLRESSLASEPSIIEYRDLSLYTSGEDILLDSIESKRISRSFVLRTLVYFLVVLDSELRSRRNLTFDGPFYVHLKIWFARVFRFVKEFARSERLLESRYNVSMRTNRTLAAHILYHRFFRIYDIEYLRLYPFALLGAGLSREVKSTSSLREPSLLLHLARDEKERASSIDEQRIDGALGIALFFSPFLSASSDPFVRNFFVRTEPLAESNPVPQDQLSAIHPPRIYAGDVASAMGFGLCRSKMMNRIVALHSPPMRNEDILGYSLYIYRYIENILEYRALKDANGTLILSRLRSAGCVGSQFASRTFHIRSSLFKHFVGGAPALESLLLLRSKRSRSLREPFYDILESSHANELFHESLRARYSRIFSIYLPIYREYPRISSFRYSKEDLRESSLASEPSIIEYRDLAKIFSYILDNIRELMQLRRRFFAFSSLARIFRTGALMDTGREHRIDRAKRVVHNGTTTLPLCWTAGANTVVSDQDQEPIRIWILTCRLFFTVGILPGSWWAHHELGRGGWWFRDPVENASFMPRLLATARIHSVILPLLHSWTSLLNTFTLPCCVSGTFSIRSGLLAPVHSSATDDTRGRFLWRFFLIMTGISMNLFYQMKQQASVLRISKKEMVVARSTLVHLRNSARAQPRPVMLYLEKRRYSLSIG